ncbi:hypothetical protein [Flavobacterium sp. JP2137]|uniref:hypothetical protein n=1 Tax=Flavobacterium sp. JP2137 TaxID=3414510 RepID=UPI003D2FCBC5
MKKINYCLTFICAALFFVGCSDDEGFSFPETTNPETGIVPPSGAKFNELQQKALENMTQRATFKAEKGIVFTSKKGVKLHIQPSTLYNYRGGIATGNVDLEFVEFYDRGDMLVPNRPLMGNNAQGGYEPLVTGGQFYVNVTQNGLDLGVFYYDMTVPAENSGGLDEGMTMWKGTFNADGNLLWGEFEPSQETGGVFPNPETNEYSVTLSEFGWSNIDRLAGIEGEKTPIIVKVPNGYDNKNSSVYVAFKGEPDVLAFLDIYDVATHSFSEHYGWGPIGFEMYVIFLSESQGKLIYAIQEVKLTKGKIINIEASELRLGTEAEITAIIKALP